MAFEFVRRGQGDKLLLIQGLSGSLHTWGEPFLAALEKHFEVVAYNHRGIGKSPRTSADFSIADLADDAAAVLDEAGWESAHVLGISMGGMVAQELALRHPPRLKTLALGCTYCGGEGSLLTSQATIQRLMAGWSSGDRELAIRAGWEVNVSPGFRADETRYAVFREMALARPIHASVIFRQMQAIFAHDTRARLPSIRCRTLVVHGTEDDMLDVANGRLIASLVPGARLETIEGAGHLFWWEEPERSAELLREHVRDS